MCSPNFSSIQQIVGGAYTYQPSLAMRRNLTKNIDKHHSSQHQDFTFFFKGNAETFVRSGEDLKLRRDVVTGEIVPHWPESELAILLGERHEILGYTLANDFSAFAIEVRGRDEAFDGTYFGKFWPGSCSLGPRFLTPAEVGDDGNLDIGLRIQRGGEVIYNYVYNTNRRKRDFRAIPELIIEYRQHFGDNPPPSKRIQLGRDGYLPAGTVVLLGAGVIVPQRAYSQEGDVVSVYSPLFGELTNRIAS